MYILNTNKNERKKQIDHFHNVTSDLSDDTVKSKQKTRSTTRRIHGITLHFCPYYITNFRSICIFNKSSRTSVSHVIVRRKQSRVSMTGYTACINMGTHTLLDKI